MRFEECCVYEVLGLNVPKWVFPADKLWMRWSGSQGSHKLTCFGCRGDGDLSCEL